MNQLQIGLILLASLIPTIGFCVLMYISRDQKNAPALTRIKLAKMRTIAKIAYFLVLMLTILTTLTMARAI